MEALTWSANRVAELAANSNSLRWHYVRGGAGGGGRRGWPRVDDMRGKVLFVVINTYTKRYMAQFPGLRGALMFVSDIKPHTDDTMFLEPANEKYDASQVVPVAFRPPGRKCVSIASSCSISAMCAWYSWAHSRTHLSGGIEWSH